MNTRENFRKRLGLKSPEEHSATVAPRIRLSGRGLGKTTEMLLSVLEHLAETGEEVNIVGVNRTITDTLVARARDYAKTLGLDPTKIKTQHRSAFENSIGLSSRPRVFVDHATALTTR
jgi:hypothetical protein